MNKAKLGKNLYTSVRLRPIARRNTIECTPLPPLDDDWIVIEANDRGVRLQNVRTHHTPLLGFDHVHHYVTDPARDWNGLRHGFLDLNVQLTLSGCNVSTEPLRQHRRAPSP